MVFHVLTLSHPTYLGPSGATAAATYSFLTQGYKPPAESRHIESDVVHNQNGKFKYVYDNGPGFRRWSNFNILCDESERFQEILGFNAEQQYAHLREMWNHKGILGMEIVEEVYSVTWAQQELEPQFIRFPDKITDPVELQVSVQFEEA